MANTKLRCICFLLAVSYAMSDTFDGGRKESVKHKGTIKTIKGMNGDVIDCVNIYQQPAFDHPLLKNHIIQMKPSSNIPNETKGDFYDAEMFQGLLDIEECPEGTIPVRHEREDEYYEHRALPSRRKNLHLQDDDYNHEGTRYARVGLKDNHGQYYQGARAFINLWHPVTNPGEVSIAQIWLRAGPSGREDTIEAGWIVNLKNVAQAKLYVKWTSGGGTGGCYNLDCPGFVQVNQKVPLGSLLSPVSTYGAKQYEIKVQIYTIFDEKWWVRVQDQEIGYWPFSIVPNLKNGATEVSWGGQIYDSWQTGLPTSTQMGGGHFPSEGFGKASYFRNLQYLDFNGNIIDVEPKDLVPYVTFPTCYDIKVAHDNNGGYKTHFYYGGPGYSATCN